MADSSPRARWLTLASALLVLLICGRTHPCLADHLVPSVKPSAMVLPLVASTNSSRASRPPVGWNGRRLLRREMVEGTSRARMPLYDDLRTSGYYTTRLFIGTPPQEFALIVDSGSSVTYVPCSTCEQCGLHQYSRFQPDLSSTYQPVKCNANCACDVENKQCTYERQYAEMSSSSGVLGEDLLSFGNQSALQPQRAVFGCENVETGELFSQHADGIMGLGRGHLSIVDQLVDKGVISDSFSLCYGGMDFGGGAMILGEISPPVGMVFSHSNPHRSPYYNIDLKEIHVDETPLPLNSAVFDGNHGTVLDSGTTYAYLPEAAFKAFKDAIVKKLHHLKPIHGPDPNYPDICFSGAENNVSELWKTFPKVEMVFKNGQKLLLDPENYLFRHSKVHGAYCLGVFQNGKDPSTLLGGIIVRNALVSYDRKSQRIGFWKTNCSELWETLHMTGAPSPAPAAPDNRNSTIFVAPSLAPSALPGISGQFVIGLITFDMSLNMTYSDLMSHISELTEYIANELGVFAYQVHLLNVTSQMNGSLIHWAIFPAESSDHISSSAALTIISRLDEHRIHLPDAFGSYKLVEWKVEPRKTRRWRQHLWVLSLAATAAVLSTLLGWLVWRYKRQAAGTYKPVDSAVPEQELQPL